jgi:hypothetical protein
MPHKATIKVSARVEFLSGGSPGEDPQVVGCRLPIFNGCQFAASLSYWIFPTVPHNMDFLKLAAHCIKHH